MANTMSSNEKLHIFFFPYMALGHVIPMVDTAKLLAMRGAKSTLLITPTNIPSVSRSIDGTQKLGFDIDVITIKMPFEEVGLPEDSDNLNNLKSTEDPMKFRTALRMLDCLLERLIEEHRPDCLVADVFMPWTDTVTSKFSIPRLVFHGTGYFARCLGESLRLDRPHDKVSDESEAFLVSKLPGEITMTRAQVPIPIKDKTDSAKFTKKEQSETELVSDGVIMNSFYELEPIYADYYGEVLGRRSWAIGPVSIGNRTVGSATNHQCLEWLDSKEPDSVVYICFGSLIKIEARQLREIAVGLEASGQQFVWVASKENDNAEEWLPQGYEERMREKGLIIRGWAPQVLILEHKAVGSFVTHCGWNSTLEGITAGASMVTWPVGADQFYNEKLVTQVLKIGTPVGAKQWKAGAIVRDDEVKSEMVEKAVKRVMVGEEAKEMRRKARELSTMAKEAVEEGGSSCLAVTSLLEELRCKKAASIV